MFIQSKNASLHIQVVVLDFAIDNLSLQEMARFGPFLKIRSIISQHRLRAENFQMGEK